MAKSTWRKLQDGEWVKDDGGFPPPSGRPNVVGASAMKAPDSPTEPCPLGTIKATVVRADNRLPIRGLVVRASGAGAGEATTDGGGVAALSKLLLGSYQVSITIPSGRALELLEPPACPDVAVTRSSTHALTIEIEPLAVVKVRVKDKERGIGIAGARVTLVGHEPSHWDIPLTNRDGIATIQGVRRGTYSAAVVLEPPVDTQFDIPATPLTFQVRSGGEHSLDIELVKHSLAWIAIELVGEDGSPMPNQRYRITFPDGTIKEGRMDSHGQARYDSVAPGDCVVCFPDLDVDAWVPL